MKLFFMQKIVLPPDRKRKVLLHFFILPLLLLSITSYSQNTFLVKGKIMDASAQPVQGASIVVKGLKGGTISNDKGEFQINASPNSTLIISSVDFETVEEKVNRSQFLNIKLTRSVSNLGEIVVVGYGTQRKGNLTNAVSTVDNKAINTVTTPDLSSALAGKLPGLQVNQIGGEPGSYNSLINIRGWGAMLVVVDGIPRADFQLIDPSTIASISILKDASAAVYGVKAANGVMLITTKKGQAGIGRITFNTSWGYQKMTEYPKAINNSIEDLILKNEAALVAGNPLPFPDYLKYTGADPNFPSVDYWALTVRDRMPMNKNDISFSGGSQKVTYFVSLGNLHQSGIYKTNSLNYNRYNFNSNITANITKGLNANLIIGGFVDKQNSPYGSSSYDFMKQVWMQPPYEPVYANNTPPFYYDGQADRNPVAITNTDLTGFRTNSNKNLTSTLSLSYDLPFVKGLQVKGVFAYDMKYEVQTSWRKAYNEYKYDAINDKYVPTGINTPSRLRKQFDDWIYTESQISLNYANSFGGGKHNVDALFLVDRRDGTGDGFLAQRYFDLATLPQINAGLTDNQIANGAQKVLDANLGLVGRVNYSYNSKYLVEFSFRDDASSLFPPATRWGFFPAVSLGWKLSSEPFIRDNLRFVNNLKIRASHGKMGDDSGAGGFQFVSGYNYPAGNGYIFDGATLTSGAATKGLANPNITWYTATTDDIGLDGILWKGALDFTLDFFQRTRTGLLGTRASTLPASFGASFPQENLNGDYSSGYEIAVGTSNTIGNFSYNVHANFTYARSKWRHFEEAQAGNSYLAWLNDKSNRFTSMRWGYGTVGQFQTEQEINSDPVVQSANGPAAYFPGDVKYQDWNGDGMIDSHDQYPITLDQDPQIYYGFDANVGWKGISLNFLLQGASGYTEMPVEQLQGPLPWGRNTLTIFEDRWHHQVPLDFSTPWVPGKYPISRDGFGFGPNKLTSTYWVKNVTYLRLKSIELSYSLPKNLIEKIKSQGVRIFLNAFDILTFKNKAITFDPEHRTQPTGGGNYGYVYPIMASYNIGANITF